LTFAAINISQPTPVAVKRVGGWPAPQFPRIHKWSRLLFYPASVGARGQLDTDDHCQRRLCARYSIRSPNITPPTAPCTFDGRCTMIEGLSDEATIGQLAGLLYEVDSQGRIKIEYKEKVRERASPHRTAPIALMLATTRPYSQMEFYTSALSDTCAHSSERPTHVEMKLPNLRRQLDSIIGKSRWLRGGGCW
jgi:hypothetical protein